jgi:hypothetical protein
MQYRLRSRTWPISGIALAFCRVARAAASAATWFQLGLPAYAVPDTTLKVTAVIVRRRIVHYILHFLLS